MNLLYTTYLTLSLLGLSYCHDHHHQREFSAKQLEKLADKWGTDWAFSGISTFAHLPHKRCLVEPGTAFDIAIIGAPFDTAVSYRPGARFGPRAIRAASARQLSFRGFNARANLNPFLAGATILDCGDIPISPFDNALAYRQMSEAFLELGRHATVTGDGTSVPKLITLGGDHSIALPALRALKDLHGQEVAVVHFDAHLDTWHPAKYPSTWIDSENPEQLSFFNHGSMFWLAGQEGLVANGSSIHAGLRTRLSGTDFGDHHDDESQGWTRVSADEIDDIGTQGVISKILETVGTKQPVYLSVDIDVLDPGIAPGTGTPEPGGWTTRELIRILRGNWNFENVHVETKLERICPR